MAYKLSARAGTPDGGRQNRYGSTHAKPGAINLSTRLHRETLSARYGVQLRDDQNLHH